MEEQMSKKNTNSSPDFFENLMKSFVADMREGPSVPEENEAQFLARLNPCTSCDHEDTVHRDPEFLYENKELDLKLKTPAYVCDHCGAIFYPPTSYKLILETEEAANGRPYTRISIKNGIISKYSLH